MLKVLKSGFYTTVQDTGRFGYRAFGVPVSGVMDTYSSQFANAILGNAEDASVLEITMTGPTLHFLDPTIIAISGANLEPILNNRPISMNVSISIKANDVISFGRLQSGFRAYLAIKNGFLTETMLGSRSMYKSITTHARINNNDLLNYNILTEDYQTSTNAHVKYDSDTIENHTLDVYKGPEFSAFPNDKHYQLLNTGFMISKYNNRMAYQLESVINNNLESILTAPVLPGTVQLTPSGQLIVLMRDCQTTGGYPRLLQLTQKAINVLSQKTLGKTVKFRLKV